MNNKRITLYKITSVGAAAAMAPSSWIKPVVRSVVLPAHAETSICGDPIDGIEFGGFLASNVFCGTSSPNRISFNLVNDRSFVTLISLNASDDIRAHISPPLPFELAVGDAVSIVLESTTNNISDCSDLNLSYSGEDERRCGVFVEIFGL